MRRARVENDPLTTGELSAADNDELQYHKQSILVAFRRRCRGCDDVAPQSSVDSADENDQSFVALAWLFALVAFGRRRRVSKLLACSPDAVDAVGFRANALSIISRTQ